MCIKEVVSLVSLPLSSIFFLSLPSKLPKLHSLTAGKKKVNEALIWTQIQPFLINATSYLLYSVYSKASESREDVKKFKLTQAAFHYSVCFLMSRTFLRPGSSMPNPSSHSASSLLFHSLSSHFSAGGHMAKLYLVNTHSEVLPLC